MSKEDIDDLNLDLTNKKILIVDDNKLNLKFAQKLLAKYNPIIDTAESGMECLEKIKSGKEYDLILLDDMMPKMRGREVLIKLKQEPKYKTPTIALTANAINGMKEQYLKDGFDDYLAKPIEKSDLCQILKKYIANNNSSTLLNPQITGIKKDSIIDFKDYSGKKVLIVDSNKIDIIITTKFLKEYNFTIESCLSGKECLNLIKSGKEYDLILVDIMILEIAGFDIINKMKQISDSSTKAVVMLADVVEDIKEKCLSNGFVGYITKPIDKKELNEVINKLFNKSTSLNNNVEYLKENGVDIDKSLELLGDIDTYNDLLKEFMDTINDKINDLNSYKSHNDLNNYAILVHSLKSDSRYLGFTKLADISLQHELKSKANDVKYVNNNFNLLLGEIREVINIINKYMN